MGVGTNEPLRKLIDSITPVDIARDDEYWERLDSLTKPPRSLGRLESLALQIARIQETTTPSVAAKTVIVAAADHGVAIEGVTPYPQDVTAQMVANFATGGSAINQIAASVGADLVVADLGVLEPYGEGEPILDRRVMPGTKNMIEGPAMTEAQCVQAILTGAALAHEAAAGGARIIATGEMGIGNTTAASALVAAYADVPVASVVGPGTGLDPQGVLRKQQVVESALGVNKVSKKDPLGTLAALGGLEIAALAGVCLGCANDGLPVVIDGFISGAAALAAARICPAASGYMIASHRSSEPGHSVLLEALDAVPVLELQMRLGEGTGATLVLGIVDAACRVMSDMATFAEAGVSPPEDG